MTTEPPVDPADPRWLISALADGEADAATVALGCAAWSEDSDVARRNWHTYHLIGDVLRSEDLCSTPAHDRDFLQSLRARLADEPVIVTLRPEPVAPVPVRVRRGWALPMAMAASVLALATTAVLVLNPAGDGAAPAGRLAAVAPERSAAPAVSLASVDVAPQSVVRDARLDRYLRAHREYGTDLPGSLPGGAGRGITTVSFDR